MDKIKIPTKQERRITVLETENADLWFENMLLKAHSDATDQEIADLWFHVITGGEA